MLHHQKEDRINMGDEESIRNPVIYTSKGSRIQTIQRWSLISDMCFLVLICAFTNFFFNCNYNYVTIDWRWWYSSSNIDDKHLSDSLLSEKGTPSLESCTSYVE